MLSADHVPAGPAAADPLLRLVPAPKAAAKFRQLRNAHEDATAAGRDLAQRQADLAQRRVSQARYVEELKAAGRRGPLRPVPPVLGGSAPPAGIEMHMGPASEGQIKGAEAELRETERELDDLASRIEQHKLRQSPILGRLAAWVRDLPLDAVLHDASDLPKLGKGERPSAAAIEAARGRIAELRAALDQVRSAPLPSGDAKKIIKRQIEQLAERGEIDTLRVVELGHPIRFPSIIASNSYSGVQVEVADAIGVMCWLFEDAIVEKLSASIDEVADDRHALGPDERQKRERQIETEILSAERLEEMLISEGEAAGLVTPRRPDADPRAILGLAA